MKRRVHPVQSVNLWVDAATPAWQEQLQDAIAENWQSAVVSNPTLFNGTVYVADQIRFEAGNVRARARPLKFAALTYWRSLGMPEVGFRSMFGSIIIRSSDRALIMARTAVHNATAGMIGFPGGTLDDADRTGNQLDPRACCLRECAEETGITTDDLDAASDLLVCHDSHRLAFGCIAVTKMNANEIVERLHAFLSTQTMPELADLFIVRDLNDLNQLAPHPVSNAFANWIFEND